MADLLYWVWLNTRLTPGTDAFAKLRASFSSPKEIFDADEDTLKNVLGARASATLQSLLDKDLRAAHRILDFAAAKNVGILTYDDPAFPRRLREIADPPVLLYYAGHLPDMENTYCVGVVGSRDCGDYGARMTFEIAHDLAVGGATVVSGLAYGADGIAAAAAIAGGGNTLAVLGSGIDVIYPKEHVKLARSVAAHGAVLTEYPPGTKPFGAHFPVRNRIISGLSDALLVTSATLDSGALITARLAKTQGRKLYALPGNVDDPHCEGTALLLREGARAAVCAEDLLYPEQDNYPGVINLFRLMEAVPLQMDKTLAAAQVSYRPRRRGILHAETEKKHEKSGKPMTQQDALTSQECEKVADAPAAFQEEPDLTALDDISRKLYEQIPLSGDCSKDELILEGISSAKITVAITKLEIKHLVKILPGGRIARAAAPARKEK